MVVEELELAAGNTFVPAVCQHRGGGDQGGARVMVVLFSPVRF